MGARGKPIGVVAFAAVGLALVVDPFAAGGAPVRKQPVRDLNPCLGPAAKRLLCPRLTISKPRDMYFERRRSGHLVLRATSSINNVGLGPVEIHGRRDGRFTM